MAVGSPARSDLAEVRQERVSALVEEQGFVRAGESILADLAAADCDMQVAEPAR